MKKSVHFNRSEIDLESLRKLKDLFGKDGELDQDAFVEAFGEILGDNLTELQLTHLFMKIDANSDGSVDWDEFTNYMFLDNQDVADDGDPGSKQEDDAGAQFFPATYDIFEINNGVKKFHKDQIAGLLYVEKTNQLLSASQDGMVRFWHPTTLVHQSGFHTGAVQPNSLMAVRGTLAYERNWITDITLMSRSNKLAVSSIDSGVAFYDLQTESRKLVGRIPMERFRHAAPLCLGYHYDAATHRELLQIGDDGGAVYIYPLRERLWSFDSEGFETSTGKRAKKLGANADDGARHADDAEDGPGGGGGGGLGGAADFDHDDGYEHEDNDEPNPFKASRNAQAAASTASLSSSSRIVFRRHTDHVTQVEYVGDLSSLVTCSLDATVNVFDLERARLKRTFTQHKKAVYSFAWCPGSKVIASSGLERHIVLWSPYSRRSVASLYGHTSSVIKVDVNEDNNQLISLSSDNTVKIWDIRNHKCIQTIGIGLANPYTRTRGNTGQPSVTCMTYVRKHKSLVAASNKLKIFPLRPPSETSLRTHNRPVVAALYNLNFHQVVSVDEQSNLRIWNVETGEVNSRFQLRATEVEDAIDQSSSRFAAAAAENSTLTAAAAGISSSGNAYGDGDEVGHDPVDALEAAKEISLSMQEGEDSNPLSLGGNGDDGVTALCFDDGGRRVVTGSHDGSCLRIWNFSNGCLLKTLLKVPEGEEGARAEDDTCGADDGQPSTSHAEVTQIIYVVNVLPRIPGHPTIRNKYIVGTGWDRRVYVWMDGLGASDGNEQGYCVRMPDRDEDLDKAHRDDITTVVYLPPDTVATGSHDGQVIFWCLSSGKITRRFREPGAPGIESMQFLSRLQMLLVAESDGGVLILDVVTSKLTQVDLFAHMRAAQPPVHGASIVSFCTDASNDLLLAGDERGRVHVWEIASRVRASKWQDEDADDLDETFLPAACWQAHQQGISTLDHVNHTRMAESFVLTGCAEGYVKMWTIMGQLIGQFGQTEHWTMDIGFAETEASQRARQTGSLLRVQDTVRARPSLRPVVKEQEFNAIASLQEKSTFRKVPGAGEVWVKLDMDMIKSVEVCRTFTDPSGRFAQIHPKVVQGLVTITRHDEITNEIKGWDGLAPSGCQETAIPMLEFLKGNESGTWIREEDFTERIGRIYRDEQDPGANPFKVLFIRCLREERVWLAVDTKAHDHQLGYETKTIAGLRPPRSISLYYRRLEIIAHLEAAKNSPGAASSDVPVTEVNVQTRHEDDSLASGTKNRKSSTGSTTSSSSNSSRSSSSSSSSSTRRKSKVSSLGSVKSDNAAATGESSDPKASPRYLYTKSHAPRAPTSTRSIHVAKRTPRRRLRLRGASHEAEAAKPALDTRQRVHEIADIPVDFGQLRATLSIAGAIERGQQHAAGAGARKAELRDRGGRHHMGI